MHMLISLFLYTFYCLLDKSHSNAFTDLYLTQCGLYSCLIWSYVLFLREEKERVEGQVLWQAARLISSVLCQPPCKTLKSVMLTSCNTVTLYRHRKKRWEGGSRYWDRAGGMEKEGRKTVDQKKKKQIQIYKQQNTPTPSSFSLFFTRWLY